MAASDELEYLKSLVSQLNEKIHALEAKAKEKVSDSAPTPAQQLRTILIGPPGAGSSFIHVEYIPKSYFILRALFSTFYRVDRTGKLQERVHRLRESRRNSVFAIWLLATCCENR